MDLTTIAESVTCLRQIGQRLLPHDIEKLHFICVGPIKEGDLGQLDPFSLLYKIAECRNKECVIEALIRIRRIDLLDLITKEQESAKSKYSVLNTTQFDKLRIALLHVADNLTDNEDLDVLKKVLATKIDRRSLGNVRTVLKLFELLIHNAILDPDERKTVEKLFYHYEKEPWFNKVRSEYVDHSGKEDNTEHSRLGAVAAVEEERALTRKLADAMIEEERERIRKGADAVIEEERIRTRRDVDAAIEDERKRTRKDADAMIQKERRRTQKRADAAIEEETKRTRNEALPGFDTNLQAQYCIFTHDYTNSDDNSDNSTQGERPLTLGSDDMKSDSTSEETHSFPADPEDSSEDGATPGKYLLTLDDVDENIGDINKGGEQPSALDDNAAADDNDDDDDDDNDDKNIEKKQPSASVDAKKSAETTTIMVRKDGGISFFNSFSSLEN